MRLLESYSQVVDALPGFKDWSKCQPFVRCLQAVGPLAIFRLLVKRSLFVFMSGPHPRALEFFLESVHAKLVGGLEMVDYPQTMLNVRKKLELWYSTDQMTSQQSLHIVVAAILNHPVNRDDHVPGPDGLDWQRLAERGTFLLDEHSHVRLPFIWFWLHASALVRLPEYAPVLGTLLV